MPTCASRARSAGVEDAALADHDAVARDQRGQPLAGRQRGLEGLEVAVVDADQARFEPQRALELGFVVHFEQHVHAERERGVSRASRAVASSTAAMMIRMQSAPQARASAT